VTERDQTTIIRSRRGKTFGFRSKQRGVTSRTLRNRNAEKGKKGRKSDHPLLFGVNIEENFMSGGENGLFKRKEKNVRWHPGGNGGGKNPVTRTDSTGNIFVMPP